MARTLRLGLILGLSAITVLAQGCVSLHTYDEQNRRIEALEAAYKGADAVVGRLNVELAAKEKQVAAKQRQLDAAMGQINATNTALTQERSDLQAQYARMVEELRVEGAGTLVINEETGGVVLEGDIFFLPGRAELQTASTGALDGLIARLKQGEFEQAVIEVAGHADSDPIERSGWDDNYQLASERARGVLNYFLSQGVAAERLYISGYGTTKPRSMTEKAQNRRVELVLHKSS